MPKNKRKALSPITWTPKQALPDVQEAQRRIHGSSVADVQAVAQEAVDQLGWSLDRAVAAARFALVCGAPPSLKGLMGADRALNWWDSWIWEEGLVRPAALEQRARAILAMVFADTKNNPKERADLPSPENVRRILAATDSREVNAAVRRLISAGASAPEIYSMMYTVLFASVLGTPVHAVDKASIRKANRVDAQQIIDATAFPRRAASKDYMEIRELLLAWVKPRYNCVFADVKSNPGNNSGAPPAESSLIGGLSVAQFVSRLRTLDPVNVSGLVAAFASSYRTVTITDLALSTLLAWCLFTFPRSPGLEDYRKARLLTTTPGLGAEFGQIRAAALTWISEHGEQIDFSVGALSSRQNQYRYVVEMFVGVPARKWIKNPTKSSLKLPAKPSRHLRPPKAPARTDRDGTPIPSDAAVARWAKSVDIAALQRAVDRVTGQMTHTDATGFFMDKGELIRAVLLASLLGTPMDAINRRQAVAAAHQDIAWQGYDEREEAEKVNEYMRLYDALKNVAYRLTPSRGYSQGTPRLHSGERKSAVTARRREMDTYMNEHGGWTDDPESRHYRWTPD